MNTADNAVTIVDCVYGLHDLDVLALADFAVRHRLNFAHMLLPVKSCHSPSDKGYLISGSEDKKVYVYSLAEGLCYGEETLEIHDVAVLTVAMNQQDTLLVSADVSGHRVCWRRSI